MKSMFTYISALKDSLCLLKSTYRWCTREEERRRKLSFFFFSPWMWAVCLDKNRTAWFWNSTFLLHICLLWKCISCILTLDLVTSSLPSGHRIYKWVRTLNRISLCTQAATSKGGSTLDHRHCRLIWSGYIFRTKHSAYEPWHVITVITVVRTERPPTPMMSLFCWFSDGLERVKASAHFICSRCVVH